MGKQLSFRPKLSTSSVMESEKESLMETLPSVGRREEAGEGGREPPQRMKELQVFACDRLHQS